MTEMPVPLTGEEQLARFIGMLRDVHTEPSAHAISVARAPAHIDVLGGFSEFAGSTVLSAGAAQAVFAGVQARQDRVLCLRMDGIGNNLWCESVAIPLSVLISDTGLVTFEQARAELTKVSHCVWTPRLAGCLYVLLASGWLEPECATGLNIFVSSDIPVESGEAASASVQVAVMSALCGHFGVQMGENELTRLCQMAELRISGTSRGIIGPLTAALCHENALMVTCCRPYDVLGHHNTPAGWQFLSIHTGSKRPYKAFRYANARTAAAMGFQILKKESRDEWAGYLCSVSADVWRPWRERMPEAMSGADFSAKYPGLPNGMTEITPSRVYRVRDCMEHAILENDRVREFLALTQMARDPSDELIMIEAGRLMLDANSSYTERLQLGSRDTELLIALAMQHGPLQGIFGATLSGNGFDNMVTLLCAEQDAERAIIETCAEFHRQTGLTPHIVNGSSSGASEFGVRSVVL